MHSQHQLEALRTAIPYIRAFKGRIFVIKLGGALCEPGRTLDHLVEQLALLYQLGVKLIVVHGGGEQANALGERLGVKPKLFAGRRITDADTLEVVQMAFAGTVNIDRRRHRAGGEAWRRLESETSNIPFLAVIQGRTEIHWSEIGWVRPLGGVFLYAAVLFWHPVVFGVAPLGG